MSFKHTARKTSRGVENTPPPCGLGLRCNCDRIFDLIEELKILPRDGDSKP